MEGLHVAIGVVIALPILWAISSAMVTHKLQSKFSNMGTIAGKTKAEILLLVGPPNSISALPEGKELLQWQCPGYHIALRFSEDVCEGVVHEFSN